MRSAAREQEQLAAAPPNVTLLVMPPGIGSLQLLGETLVPDADRVVTVPAVYAQALLQADGMDSRPPKGATLWIFDRPEESP